MGYKEVLKVIVGMALWDFLVAVWFIVWGSKPVTFFWLTFNTMGLIIVAAIDLAIVIGLSLFVWSGKKSETPKTSSAPATPEKLSVQAKPVAAPAAAAPAS